MDAVGAVGARMKYSEALTPNEAGGGTCMLRRAIIPLTCMFYCIVYVVRRKLLATTMHPWRIRQVRSASSREDYTGDSRGRQRAEPVRMSYQ